MSKNQRLYTFRVTPNEFVYGDPNAEEAGAFTMTATGDSSLMRIMDAIEEALPSFAAPDSATLVWERQNELFRKHLREEDTLDGVGLVVGHEIWLWGHADWTLVVEAVGRASPSQRAGVVVDLAGLDVDLMDELVNEASNEEIEDIKVVYRLLGAGQFRNLATGSIAPFDVFFREDNNLNLGYLAVLPQEAPGGIVRKEQGHLSVLRGKGETPLVFEGTKFEEWACLLVHELGLEPYNLLDIIRPELQKGLPRGAKDIRGIAVTFSTDPGQTVEGKARFLIISNGDYFKNRDAIQVVLQSEW